MCVMHPRVEIVYLREKLCPYPPPHNPGPVNNSMAETVDLGIESTAFVTSTIFVILSDSDSLK